VVKSRSK
jgi:hypothetical protein